MTANTMGTICARSRSWVGTGFYTGVVSSVSFVRVCRCCCCCCCCCCKRNERSERRSLTHHRRGGRVVDPHGQEHGVEHESGHQPLSVKEGRYFYGTNNNNSKEKEPSGTGADEHEDSEGDALVQVAVLDGDGHDEATDEHHVGLLHVGDADLSGAHDTQQRQQHHRQQTGHRQRQRFRHPERRHQQDHVSRPSFLRRRRQHPRFRLRFRTKKNNKKLDTINKKVERGPATTGHRALSLSPPVVRLG